MSLDLHELHEVRCPACRARLLSLFEPHRWLCTVCRKVWEIRDVLAEAVQAIEQDKNDPRLKRLFPAKENAS